MVRRGSRGRGGEAGRIAPALGLLLLALALPAAAEVSSSVTLSAYATLGRQAEVDEDRNITRPAAASAAAYLKGRLDLQAIGNQNVKAQLQMDGYVADSVYVDIPRAWIKVRLPWLRLTIGKTRLSWGEGFVFNAGDVIFGSMNAPGGDLSAAALRDETAWLASVYVPLGPFSFLEAAVLPFGVSPPAGGLSDELGSLLSPRPFADLAGGAGLRGVFRLGGMKVEPGWYANWADGAHRPYLSLQGHLLVDWNLSAALGIPITDPDWAEAGRWLGLSAGLFQLFRLGGDRSLALRLEAALRPAAAWEEITGSAAPVYGLLLFPEAALALSDTLSLQLRALVCPVDGSGLGLLGVSWGVYQGLTLSANVAAVAGEADDLYRWREGGPYLTAGAEFTY